MVDYKKKKGGLELLGRSNSESLGKAVETSTATALFNRNDVTLRRELAVSNPSAQITKLCNPGPGDNVDDLSTALYKLSMLRENPTLLMGIRLMLLHGLRVTEMLHITPQCVMRDGSVFVRGLKGSKDRVVLDSYMYKEWLVYKSMNCNDLVYFDRYYVYRLFKKLGLYAVYGNNRNNSVTHSCRHNVALGLKSDGLELENIQDVMGHKSIKSTEFYVRDKK